MAPHRWLRRVPVRIRADVDDLLPLILVTFLGLAVWMYETAVWIVAWCLYGPFLAVRKLMSA